MLVQRLTVCVPTMVAVGLALAGPAHAQEPVDVAALEARIEAAVELVELPAEPDWGVPDPASTLPAVTQDAPEVPTAPAELVKAAPEPRYHREEPQYRTEYQAPKVDSAPPPVEQSESAPASAAPVPAPATSASLPVTPAPAQVPVQSQAPTTQSTPTIWIWIWNWTWVQGADDRYRGSGDQYQIEGSILSQDVAQIVERIGIQMPVQIGVQTRSSIADEIAKEIVSGSPPPDAPVAAPAPTVRLDAYRGAAETERTKPARRRTSAPSSTVLERPFGAPLEAATEAAPVPAMPHSTVAPRQAERSGKPQRVRRPDRRAPVSPLPAERFADSTAATGASAGIFLKNFAVLIASLMLAALGRGRRLRLSSPRWRGLLGTRTDPPG